VGGERISSAKALCDIVEKTGGELRITVKRCGEEKSFIVRSAIGTDGKYKIGVLARDNAAGIGTVTFIDPETRVFAGLGHGICDGETGELVPVSYGTCEEVSLTDIVKGKKGAPGELRGFFTGNKTGKIIKNSYSGVVGALCAVPEELSASVYPAVGKGKVHNGKAKIIATVDGGGRAEYEINISSVDESCAQKNFTVEITDESLIAKTGGIVQGMSGSPIIQDGYLVGAVTHVMVSDPTKGYGILIENMLSQTVSLCVLPIAA
jgi:stage IV sporulation protein B